MYHPFPGKRRIRTHSMHRLRQVCFAAAFATICCTPVAGHAKTLRWSTQGDIVTLDPHSQNETLVFIAARHVYESLLRRDENFQLTPMLATSWEAISPTVWRFKLREGVRFHDGTPFEADDVVFSFERALSPTSHVKIYANGVKRVRAIDTHTVEIETEAPNPILLPQIFNVLIMNRDWAEKYNALAPQDFTNREETYSARNTNGTGPYKLKSREVDVRTVYEENPDWWGKPAKKGNVTDIVYTPIAQNATRTAALLSGEIDLVQDPPVQDVERLRRQVKVIEGNDIRTIYLGFDLARPALQYSTIEGKNPFQDVRVREALYRAIDVETIKKTVMRGLSVPTGALIAPQVHGWTPAMAQRTPYDPNHARALLKDAGYDGTLDFTLDCPNNRYINDEAICQAIVAMWARVGVKATLNAMPRATFFPKVQSLDTSAYLFGLTTPPLDAIFNLQVLIHSRGEGGDGSFNLGRYSNPEVDRLIDLVKTEMDPVKRDAAIHQAYAIVAQEFGYIPLHHQVIPWAMKKNVHVQHRANNELVVEWITID